MNKKVLAIFPLIALLSAGALPMLSKPGREIGDDKYYALYMYNYPRVNTTSVNGMTIRGENLLYKKVEITLGEKLEKPEDPTRTAYEFEGWFTDKSQTNEWDFDNDVANGSLILYAKWGVSASSEYVEPEYTYPETIITDAAFRVTGIFNEPIENGTVKLPTGAIKRLENQPSDVKDAVNYERRQDVTFTASYDKSNKVIHIVPSEGVAVNITVKDNSAQLVVEGNDGIYEKKAANYEVRDADFKYHRIVLGGSSSMENWASSKEDMNPIITTNHGIGGTTVGQWIDCLFERLVMPYTPKAVVYYVGVNNIINSGDDGDTTGHLLEDLFDKTHQYLPNTKVFYVLINKLPGYASYQGQFDIANNMAIEYAKRNDFVTCIDAGIGLLKENGEPHHAYFKTDGLHMSQFGYTIWGAAVKQAIIDWLG